MTIWDYLFTRKEECFGGSEFLYHYTSVDTFKKFVEEGGDFFCTDFRMLNDRLELMIGIEFVCKFLRDQLQWDELETLSFKNIYAHSILAEGVVVPWVMSFSRARDNLNQWRAYTDHRKGGVAVGIRRAQLWDAIDRLPGRYSKSIELDSHSGDTRKGFELRLLPCLYAERDKRLIEDQVSEVLIQHLDVFRRIGVGDATRLSEDLIFAINSVLELSAIIKHDSFCYEEEERLVILPMTRSDADCTIINGKKRWRTYLAEVQREGVMSAKFRGLRGLIRDVVISPHGDSDALYTEVRELLDKYDMTFCSLEHSILPYR